MPLVDRPEFLTWLSRCPLAICGSPALRAGRAVKVHRVSSTNSIVAQYWAGVQQRLEAEVTVFAELVRHEAERGRENEAVLARILGSFVPRRYGVGSGLLIDSSDHYSRQTDVVLFDQSDELAVLAQTTQLLFPVENVLAGIEVKTTLRKEDIEDCALKHEDLLRLEPSREHPDGTSHPLFVVLAYTAGPRPATLISHFRSSDHATRPELGCVLGPGLVFGSTPLVASDQVSGLAAGLCLLRDENGDYIEGKPTGPEMMATYGGRQYPVVKYEGQNLLVDRARALLLFVEALVALLAEKQGRPAPAISAYVTKEMRSLAPLTGG
jgi:hypothetical protein